MRNETSNEHCKLVYAHFGLAMYLAQCLESSIVIMLVLLDLLPRRAPVEKMAGERFVEFDKFIGGKFEQTLGKSMADLRGFTVVPPGLEEMLRQSLKRRNRLAHGYFREHAEQFMSESGREKMLQKLKEDQEIFEAADDLLDLMIKPLREKYGLTDDVVETQYRNAIATIDCDLED